MMMFDPQSSTWLAFEAKLASERLDLLEELASENLSERESDVLRGKITLIDYIDDIKAQLE